MILFSFDQSFIAPTIVIVMAMAHVTFITENVTVIKIGTLNWIAQVYCKFLDDEPSSLDPVYFTLHLKIKKLSTNSSGDFDSVLDTINHY